MRAEEAGGFQGRQCPDRLADPPGDDGPEAPEPEGGLLNPASPSAAGAAGASPPPASGRWPVPSAAFVLLLAASFLSFGASLRGAFVWDDPFFAIERGREIEPSWENVRRILFGHVHDTYRPLRALSYMADGFFWRIEPDPPPPAPFPRPSTLLLPEGYHLGNVLLHAACVLAAFVLGRRLLGDPSAAFLGALLFATHPVHAENVAYVKGRTDLLAAFFLLLAWIRILRPARRVDLPTLLLFLAALLSREGSVIFLPIAFLTLWWHENLGFRESFRRTLPLLALAAVFLAGYASLGPPAAFREGSFTGGTGAAALLGLECLGTYLRLLFWPVSLTADYIGLEAAPRDPVAVALGLLALATLAFLLVRLGLFLARGRPMGFPAFALACAVLTLLPVSNLVPIKALLAERYLYVGSLPVLLAAGLALSRPRLRPAGLALAMIFLALSMRRTLDWRAEKPLWESCVRNHPWAWRAGLNLCNAHADEPAAPPAVRTRRALAAAGLGLRANPWAPDLWHEMGYVLLRAGRPADALAPLRQAHALSPRDPQTRNLLLGALEWIAATLRDEAEASLGDILRSDPSLRPEAERRPALKSLLPR